MATIAGLEFHKGIAASKRAAAFLALGAPDPWRPAFDRWAKRLDLSRNERIAVLSAVLCERVIAALEGSRPRRARNRR